MPRNTENINSHEQAKEETLSRQIGAQVLTTTGFENRQKEIVESSFNKAIKQGEKLPGKNNERRNYAYLSRLEKLVGKYGNDLEKKLWDASLDKMIIDPKNITDGYWKTQEQILRDNGQGRELSDHEKSILTEDIQKQQRESLESWSNYLGDKNSPYPLWFKVYAWDGVSKMGVFDKEKGYFKKRDEHTVAPYPKLNPAVLAKVYGAVADFYDIKDKQRYEENGERNEILEGLAASGNFNKLYSKILLSQKAIPKTPERTEDVHGEWIEYLPGEEEKLASAAEGTPWCVADPGTGRNYLEYGSYTDGQEDEYGDYDDYDDYCYKDDNQAKFILFHLYDPEKNTLSESACASIRLNPEGRVAEISGLNEGQALEDSLVPIVEEKVKTLPGGEDFLEAFADKQELIRLDHKMQNNEDLTKEELEFIYAINRPIRTLDTYNTEDPRIDELKEKYNIEYALDKGVDADALVDCLPAESVLENIDTLKKYTDTIDLNHLISELDYSTFEQHLTDILARSDIDKNTLIWRIPKTMLLEDFDDMVEKYHLDPTAIVKEVSYRYREVGDDFLLKALDLKADPNTILEIKRGKLDDAHIIKALIDHGVDQNQLLEVLSSPYSEYPVYKHLDDLLEFGIDGVNLASCIKDQTIIDNFEKLISRGADPASVFNCLSGKIARYRGKEAIDKLVANGVDINLIASKVEDLSFVHLLKDMTAHGLDLDAVTNDIWLGPWNIGEAIESGANIDALAKKFAHATSGYKYWDYNDKYFMALQKLVEKGADINTAASSLPARVVLHHIDLLKKLGLQININTLLDELATDVWGQSDLYEHPDILVKYGADIKDIVSKIEYPANILRHYDDFIKAGATFTTEEMSDYATRMGSDDVLRYIDIFNQYGVNLDTKNITTS